MDSYPKIKTIIYRLLAGREYSSSQIEQKLLGLGFKANDITTSLNELCQEGSINDLRFTENYIRSQQAKGYGPLRIRQALQIYGISKEMIEDQLNIADNAWFIEAYRVWQKRFRGRLPVHLKDRGKQLRFMQYRGFTQEHIEYIFKQKI